MSKSNIQIVQDAYAAFGSGDIAALVAMMTPDVVWSVPGPAVIPVAGTSHGREGVADFFRTLVESDDVRRFEPREFLAGGDKVVVLGFYEAIARATGKVFTEEWVHVFTIQDGWITAFLEHFDTVPVAAAYVSETAVVG